MLWSRRPTSVSCKRGHIPESITLCPHYKGTRKPELPGGVPSRTATNLFPLTDARCFSWSAESSSSIIRKPGCKTLLQIAYLYRFCLPQPVLHFLPLLVPMACLRCHRATFSWTKSPQVNLIFSSPHTATAPALSQHSGVTEVLWNNFQKMQALLFLNYRLNLHVRLNSVKHVSFNGKKAWTSEILQRMHTYFILGNTLKFIS